MYIFLVAAIVALVLLFFLGFLTLLILSEGKKPKKSNQAQKAKKTAINTDLDKMIESARSSNLSDSELRELAKVFIDTHKLGSKTSKELDEKTKRKLEFISAFASNANASVESMSFLNKELKKISNSYKKEIDAYEQMGLAKRKMKQS